MTTDNTEELHKEIMALKADVEQIKGFMAQFNNVRLVTERDLHATLKSYGISKPLIAR